MNIPKCVVTHEIMSYMNDKDILHLRYTSRFIFNEYLKRFNFGHPSTISINDIPKHRFILEYAIINLDLPLLILLFKTYNINPNCKMYLSNGKGRMKQLPIYLSTKNAIADKQCGYNEFSMLYERLYEFKFTFESLTMLEKLKDMSHRLDIPKHYIWNSVMNSSEVKKITHTEQSSSFTNIYRSILSYML